MCEIATIPVGSVDSDSDNRQRRIEKALELAQFFYDANPHGLGIVAVHREDGEFQNKAFKTGWTDNGMSDVATYEFLDEQIDDAWRFVVHARFATAGDVDKKGTHPIIIDDCEETPWQAVLHNGSVSGHTYKRRRLKKDGHTFSTEVDSEVIAHETEMPDPDTFGTDDSDWDVPNLRGNLNYVLFSEEMILAYTQGKYHISDGFTMACNHRDFNTDRPAQGEEGWFLFTPDGEVKFRENEKPTHSSLSKTTTAKTNTSRNPWAGWGTRGYGSTQQTLDSVPSEDEESEEPEGNPYVALGNDSSDDVDESQTRQTLLRAHHDQNPPRGSDEALPEGEHAGYFVGADEMLCLEHGRPFQFVCTDCRRDFEKQTLEQVGLVYVPDIYPAGYSHEGEVNTSAGTREVARCPTTEEWYINETCPTCGVDHTEPVARRPRSSY